MAFALAVWLLAGGALAQGKPGLDEATQALFDAVLVNDLEAVKASVNDNANLEARDRWGMTPIDLAVDRGHFKIAHFLLSVRNFRRDQDDDRGATDEATVPPPPEPQRAPAGGLGGTLGGSVGGTAAAPQTPTDAAPGPALAAPPPAPAPPVPAKPRGVASREIAPPGAEPQAQLAARPQWPAGQPNPFDPQVAAPGSSLEIIGNVAQPEARPGLKPTPAATPRPTPTVSGPRADAAARAPEPAAQAAAPTAPAPQPASKPESAAAGPVAPTPPEPEKTVAAAPAAPEPEKAAAAGTAQESGSGQGFFGRMLGAIGLGGDEEMTEEPAPTDAGEAADSKEPEVAAAQPQATEPPAAANEQPPTPRVTVESTPILRPSPEAEQIAVAEPQAPATAARVRQTQPRVVIRRTEVVQPEPPAPSPAPETASPPPQQVAAAPQEESGFFDRMGSLFSGDDTPPAEGEEKPGFFGRLASLVPDLGGDGSAEESAAEASAPAAETSTAPATETAAGTAKADGTEEAEDSEPKEIRGWIGQALDYVGLGDDEADIQARQEARAAAAAAPKAPPPTRKPGRQVSRTQPVAQPKIDRVQSREPLRGVALTLGETTGLGQAAPPVAGDARRPEGCATKRRDTMLFCVRPVDWPVEMEPHFRVATIMYQGAKAVVRYADGETARFHAIFPAESFNAVAAYFERRFGPPTDEFRREVRPFASTPLANPALMWQSVVGSADGERIAVLELRRYDDVRGGFPDTKHGVVMLYWTDAPPIFPQLSSMDLMMIQWSRTR